MFPFILIVCTIMSQKLQHVTQNYVAIKNKHIRWVQLQCSALIVRGILIIFFKNWDLINVLANRNEGKSALWKFRLIFILYAVVLIVREHRQISFEDSKVYFKNLSNVTLFMLNAYSSPSTIRVYRITCAHNDRNRINQDFHTCELNVFCWIV